MNQPLVSVVVITYNSSSYILEGLESVKAQTYKNIELIISDDCSIDNTVEICQEWLDENKSYFRRVELVTTPKNTGVAGNLNRGIIAAHGEWIKGLSGDDKFLPFTIERYVDFVSNHPESEIIFGKLYIYGPDETLVNKSRNHYENIFYPKIRLNQKQQYRENLKSLFVPGPGLFYKKSLWRLIGGFDERYQFCEEDPFMFKIYKSGRKVYFLEEEVYIYQVHKGSLARNNNTISRHIADRIRFFRKQRRTEMLKAGLYLNVFNEGVLYKIMETKMKKKHYLYWFYKFLLILSPLRYTNRLSKIIFSH